MLLSHQLLRVTLFAGLIAAMTCSDLAAQAPPRSSSAGRAQLNDGAEAPAPRRGAQAQPGQGAGRVAGVPGKAPAMNRPPLPQGQAMRIPQVTKEVEDILVEWEEKSSAIKRLEGTFERTTYDSVFSVELIAKGRYCFEFPDKGSFQQFGTPTKEGQKGRRFTAQPGHDERWVCDGSKILKIDDKKKEYEEVTIPAEDRGQNIRNSPLPFLFGLKAVEAKQRYAFELNPKTNEKQIWLKVRPLLQQDLANYKSAEVILDRTNCLPIAVKLFDTTGNKEDVYYFPRDKMTVNRNGWVTWLTGNPLKPDLTDFKKLIQPENAAAPRGQQIAKPPVDRRSADVQTSSPRNQPQRTAQLLNDEDVPSAKPARSRVAP